MPVLVTSAHRPLARRLVVRLLAEGGEVRAYANGDTQAVRAAGAFVAMGEVDDEGRLEASCADVHTLIHLGGGVLTPDPMSMVDDVEVVLRAASNAGVRRLIALSIPGADPNAGDAVRRAKGEVEQRLADARLPTVVVRSSLVDTPAIRDALATSGLGPEARESLIAPVRAGDLVELLVAFDQARSTAQSGHVVVSADGPVRRTVTEYLERSGAHGPGRGSLVGRKLSAAWLTVQLQDVLAGPWWTEDPVVVDGWQFAGLSPTTPGIPEEA